MSFQIIQPPQTNHITQTELLNWFNLVLSNNVPMIETLTANSGVSDKISRYDHSHPRTSSTLTGTTNSTGFSNVSFTRSYSSQPVVFITTIENNTNPVPHFKITQWNTSANGYYTGCTIYGDRNKSLPSITPISTGISLISNLITSLNIIFSSLSGYSPYEPASNENFCLIAVEIS